MRIFLPVDLLLRERRHESEITRPDAAEQRSSAPGIGVAPSTLQHLPGSVRTLFAAAVSGGVPAPVVHDLVQSGSRIGELGEIVLH